VNTPAVETVELLDLGEATPAWRAIAPMSGPRVMPDATLLPDGTVLEARKMRGIVSEGMVLAQDELGIGEDHSGIYILDAATPPGRPLSEVLGDVVLDLEITPNRPDCLSMIGVAREVAALTGQTVREPDLDVVAQHILLTHNDVMAGLEVCAFPTAGETGNCAVTDASGAYTVPGLPSGNYRVQFGPPSSSTLNYLTQYYNGKATETEADQVSVTVGAVTPNVDASMQVGGEIRGVTADSIRAIQQPAESLSKVIAEWDVRRRLGRCKAQSRNGAVAPKSCWNQPLNLSLNTNPCRGAEKPSGE